MSLSMKKSAPDVDIDALLQDTWLQVISLRQGMVCPEGEGQKFWQRCVTDIEHTYQTLLAAGVSEQSCQHIQYAQCAVLDETVKGRGVEDDAYFVWCHSPLQAHFFNTLDAGDQLYERMRSVLREAVPDPGVLTCFHRVLMLGFLGGYLAPDAPARQHLVEQISAYVPPFSLAPTQAVLAVAASRSRLSAAFRYWPMRLGLAALTVGLLWWGLHHWLSSLLLTVLPGAVP